MPLFAFGLKPHFAEGGAGRCSYRPEKNCNNCNNCNSCNVWHTQGDLGQMLNLSMLRGGERDNAGKVWRCFGVDEAVPAFFSRK